MSYYDVTSTGKVTIVAIIFFTLSTSSYSNYYTLGISITNYSKASGLIGKYIVGFNKDKGVIYFAHSVYVCISVKFSYNSQCL